MLRTRVLSQLVLLPVRSFARRPPVLKSRVCHGSDSNAPSSVCYLTSFLMLRPVFYRQPLIRGGRALNGRLVAETVAARGVPG